MDFSGDEKIRFCDNATASEVSMRTYYGIIIPGVHDLQRLIIKPTANYPSSLYALSNAYIRTNLSEKGSNFIGHDRWSNFH
jgi:hypothetical protein